MRGKGTRRVKQVKIGGRRRTRKKRGGLFNWFFNATAILII